MNNLEAKISEQPVAYLDAINLMEARIADIYNQKLPELVWHLEHPALYTAGSSACDKDLINNLNFPVHATGRGGQYTYHGPGQRIVYLMLDLRKRGADIRKYVENLEDWIISSLAHFGVRGERKQGRIGIWVTTEDGLEAKIAAIGIRVRKWITYHGISINVDPNLSHYQGIIPCGISEFGVTSLKQLGYDISYEELDTALKVKFNEFF